MDMVLNNVMLYGGELHRGEALTVFLNNYDNDKLNSVDVVVPTTYSFIIYNAQFSIQHILPLVRGHS
jgi:hypothetical protein